MEDQLGLIPTIDIIDRWINELFQGDSSSDFEFNTVTLMKLRFNNFPTKYMINSSGKKTGKYIVEYPQGGVFLSRQYINGKRDGEFTINYPSGVLAVEANYFEGLLHGRYRRYDSTGSVLTKGSYHRGLRIGKWKWYRSEGKMRAQGQFVIVDGKSVYHGQCAIYRSNGSVVREIYYREGKREGTFFASHSDGRSKVSGSYLDDKLHGICFFHYPNGNMMSQIPYVNGQIEGTTFEYSDNEILLREQSYVAGKLHGTSIEYGPNKSIMCVSNYVSGSLSGIERMFHLDGSIMSENSYLGGLLHGESRRYYDNNKLRSLVVYQHGRRDGISLSFHHSGALDHVVYYRADARDGPSVQFWDCTDDDRFCVNSYLSDSSSSEELPSLNLSLSLSLSLSDSDCTSNDLSSNLDSYYLRRCEDERLLLKEVRKTLSSYQIDMFHGKVRSIDQYRSGKRNGMSSRWRSNGTPSHRGYYIQDTLSGYQIRHDRRGQILTSFRYETGKRMGYSMIYDKNGKMISMIPYHHDLIDGLVRTFRDKEVRETRYHKGKPNGTFVCTRDGVVIESGEYEKGKKIGLWIKIDDQVVRTWYGDNGEALLVEITDLEGNAINQSEQPEESEQSQQKL